MNFPNPVQTRADLFGRDQELQRIQATLRLSKRRPIIIMGERLMGKTSLLNVALEWVTQDNQVVLIRLPHVASREQFVEEILEYGL